MIIKREIEQSLLSQWKNGKVLVLTGARRVGKTELIKTITKGIEEPFMLLNGEDVAVQELLERNSAEHFRQLLGNTRSLIIDEAQKIERIGSKLKLMIDEIEGLRILVTGSSAFGLNNEIGEPLTGRMNSMQLFPLSEYEQRSNENVTQHKDRLYDRLVFGSYPELVGMSQKEEKTRYLNELVSTYLLKDILAFENIKNSSKIKNLLRLISFQVGNEISYHELGRQLGMSKNTVEKYLDLLEKVFVLFKVEGFSRNLRKEITKSSRYYFYDNGLRNLLIANLNPIAIRNDVGQLWENYVISERVKRLSYSKTLVNTYFWRTYDQQEIDWVEERGGQLYAYKVKWNPRKKIKIPKAWDKAYPESVFQRISEDNYLEWVL